VTGRPQRDPEAVTWPPLDAIPPASWAVVMACGIVSTDLSSDHQPVLSAIMLWLAAGAWLLLTVVLGTRLEVSRWATVFPLGMYAACSFAAGQVAGISGIADFGRVWTWVAFTVSLLALAGLLRVAKKLIPAPS
jgi:tellurite resistance protein TehA-like permease